MCQVEAMQRDQKSVTYLSTIRCCRLEPLGIVKSIMTRGLTRLRTGLGSGQRGVQSGKFSSVYVCSHATLRCYPEWTKRTPRFI
jgi:hypothetical protein